MIRSPAVLLLLASFLASAQTSPEFEAASVKPVPPGTPYGGMRGGPGTSSPGQIPLSGRDTTRRSRDGLWGTAIPDHWSALVRRRALRNCCKDLTRYNLVAVSSHVAEPACRSLFHLALHKEMRSSSVYEMTVARSGFKIEACSVTRNSGPAIRRHSYLTILRHAVE